MFRFWIVCLGEEIVNLDAIGIISKDIRCSVQFYKILGLFFNQISADHWEGNTVKGVRIMLDSVDLMKKLNPDWKEQEGGKVVLCFKQDSSEKVDELYHKIEKSGFKVLKPPWNAFWGQRYLSVLDPDGNQVDIFAPL